MRTNFAIALALALSLSFFAEGQEAPNPGRISDNVACKADATQSYALYLPSKYIATEKWPIIFCFDPAARGKVPVTLLKDAAEKYGYIVMGSNNSRNGPDEPIQKAIAAMLKEAAESYSVDEKRFYACGFSGGARVSMQLAMSKPENFSGVIACSAFTYGESLPAKIPFAVFGTAGNEDFNYMEMRGADAFLKASKATAWIEYFEGPHTWPQAQVLRDGVEFLQIAAMREGKIPADKKFIAAVAAARLASADDLAKRNPLLGLYKYENIAAFFADESVSVEAASNRQRLSEKPEIAKALQQEQEFAAKRKALLSSAPGQAQFDSALEWFTAAAKQEGILGAQAKMQLGILCEMLAQQGAVLQTQNRYDLSLKLLEAALKIDNRDPNLNYNAACAYAKTGNKAKAVESLQAAVKAGFKDKAHIEADRDLDNIRTEDGYKKALDAIKKNKP